jgi:cytochrome c-type biogenesis protein CcmE
MNRSFITKVALTAAVAVGGGGFLVYSSIGDAEHYRMVDELIADGVETWANKELKVHGFVESGTIVENVVGQVQHRTFVLQKNGKKMRVFSQGPKPDTFKDQSEVVATGRLIKASEMQAIATALCNNNPTAGSSCPIRSDLEQAWVVDSTNLMAKCPSKYDGATSNKIDTQFKAPDS